MSNPKLPTYTLRFFFDYGCGGCLWAGNDATYEKYGVGTLDAEATDLNGNVRDEMRIKLPDSIRQQVLALDQLFCESLDWSNPGGPSLWSEEQWNDFQRQAKVLHREIAEFLGDDFEVVYKQ